MSGEVGSEHVSHTGRLWRWTGGSGSGTWHFLTIDGAAGEALSGQDGARGAVLLTAVAAGQ